MSRQVHPAYHEDAEFFRAAVAFTEAQTGFNARLIEKDYFCSLLLHGLQDAFARGLVFKGGTALSKVHCDFYRLSEDLDFSMRLPEYTTTRGKRRKCIQPVKDNIGKFAERLDIRIEGVDNPGRNESKQYIYYFMYGRVFSS